MTACFQNGLFHDSRFNDRQQKPYAYGFVRIGNRKKKKKQSHISVAKKICRWTTLKEKEFRPFRDYFFFLQQIFISMSATLRASCNNKSSRLHASFSCAPFLPTKLAEIIPGPYE